MNKYSKILHHISTSDMKTTRTRNLLEKKRQEDEIIEDKEYLQDVMRTLKSDWRSSFDEQMSTADVFSYAADAEPGVDLTVVDASLDASFGHDQGGVDVGYPANGLMGGTVIRDSGTGTGENGGFNIGKHLAFTGDSYYNTRWAALNPVDSSAFDTFTITAIRGNDTNGGEDPDEAGEQLELFYRNKDMAPTGWKPINTDPAGNVLSGVEKIIIPLGSDSSGLQNWSLDIPAHARTPSTQFMLFQATSSGTEYDHYGITKISFRRNTPINVVVPLSDPKSISFVRVGSNEGDPKKRKKKLNDQLEASDNYTTKTLGSQFPGQGARIGGEDPFKSTTVISDKEIKASPIGSEEVKKQFGAAKLKSALGQGEPKKGDPQTKVTNIIKGDQDKPQTGDTKTLPTFQKDKEATKVSVAQQEKISAEKKQVQYDKKSVEEVERVVKKDSKEIKKIVDSLPQEQVDKIIKSIPENELIALAKTLSKAKDIAYDTANPLNIINKITPDIVKSKIADVAIDIIGTVTNPIVKAKTASNGLNAYDDFLGKLSTNKNTEGSSFNNPIDVAKEITKGDMGQLQNTVNSSEYKKLVSQLKTASQSEIPKIKTKLEGMITNTIHANFGLDNFLHNNVKVDVNHLLETGRTRLTKQYTFKPGSSVATAEKNPFFVAIADITGMPLDTWGAASIPDWMTIPGPSLIGLPVVLAQTFAPAIAAKVGLGNAEKHGGAYAAPGMYMELEIPEGQLDAKQENQPSTEEKKNNLSNLIGFGDEEEGKITSAGETLSDGEMKSLEKMGLTPAQIKRVMDAGGANDLKDLAAGGVEAYEYRDVETQSDVDWSDPKMVDYYMNNVFDDKPVPHDDTLLKLMLSATQGGKVLNALGGIINAIGKWWNEGKTFGPKGEEGWSWNKLLQDDWLKKQLNDKTGKWNPFRSLYVWAKDKGGMLSGPTPMTREFFRRLGPMGAQLLEKIKQIGFDENVKPAIEKMSTSELNTRVNEIWDKDPKGVEKIYTPLVEKDPTYQKYNSLWQEEDKIRTDYKQYGQDEYNLEWKLYRAEQEIGKAYYGVTSNWDDTVPGWQGTGDNKGYSDSILGRGDAAQKALDEFKYQPSVWKGDKLVSGGGSWDEKTQWDRSPYSYANYQKIEKAWSDSYPVETKGKDSNASAKMSDAKDKSFVKLYNKVKSAFGIDPQTVSRGTKVPSPVNDVISQWNSMWSKYDSALKAWQNENDKLNTWNKKEINRLQGEVDRLDKEAENYRQTHMNPLWDAQRKARELGKEIADIDLESTFDKIGREVLTQWEFAHLEDEWKDGKYKDEEFKIDGTQVAGVNYDLDNWIDKTYGSGASNWYRQSDGKTEGNPFIPAGSYIPKASIKDIEYKKKLKAYSIDEPIVATTSQSKKKRKRTQVAHYQPQGTMIKETTFSRIKKMRKKFDYEGKPSPDGFPDNEPPKLDPKTGMHPNYGKNASRYKKLDPVSARAMPKTGDPETDAEVAKAAKKPK